MPIAIASSTSFLKNAGYVVIFLATVDYLGFDPRSISILTILMFIDMVTGIARSCVNEGCRSIKSAIGIRGLLAKILVLTSLFSIGLAGRGIGFDMQLIVQGAVNILILSETYSILGNVHSAKTGKKKNEFDAVAYLMGQVRDLLRRSIKHE